ncbi:MAG: DNA polymerase II, partial [Nanoarchaeota archaeon]|nr:DNA polymerase II [Nanoarchaeota archaeon]
FIKTYVADLKAAKFDDELVYRKKLTKQLSSYEKTTPPHVKAARKLPSLESNVIEYYITLDGPEPIQKLKHKLDYEHYVEKQIKPIAEQILSLFNEKFEDLAQETRQTKLF